MSETHVKRGHRVVGAGKELEETLGGNDLCPRGSTRRYRRWRRTTGRTNGDHYLPGISGL